MKRCCGVLWILSSWIASHSFAESATWSSNPVSNDWYTPENWVPPTIPNGPDDIATIGPSTITAIVIPEQSVTVLDRVVFQTSSDITLANGASLAFKGAGALASGVTASIFSALGSSILFDNSSTCEAILSVHGQVTFQDQAKVTQLINCYGGEPGEEGGTVFFFDQSAIAAGGGLIVFGRSFGGQPGKVYFNDDSTVPDNSAFAVIGRGTIDISCHKAPGLALASLSSGGVVNLGSNDLTLTRDFLSRSFTAIIRDGGACGGGQGSVTKAGVKTDTLTLINDNTYTGGTMLEGGTLLARNKTGSATGSGPVQVNAGRLGGDGTITGAVTVGSGTGNMAMLFAGSQANLPGKLTIQQSLTFASDGLYRVTIDSPHSRSTIVSAKGVAIDRSATMRITDNGNQTLSNGTALTLIDNTAETPISGTFKKLPDGVEITVGLNTFQVSYSGGDGNDLTLTVVP